MTKRNAPVERRRVGRPTAYRGEYCEQAYKLCLLGATDAEMADFFGVDPKTIERWRVAHEEFCRSTMRGKVIADANMAERLYMRGMGYSHEAVKIFMPAGATEPVYAPYTEHYPPDTQANSLWLRNRQPAKWRDKQEHELTGKDGGPIAVQRIERVIVDSPNTDREGIRPAPKAS